VQHAVRERRLLCDFTQAGPGVAELAEGGQGGIGQFAPPSLELVDAAALETVGRDGSDRLPVRHQTPLPGPDTLAGLTQSTGTTPNPVVA
jgi:hypothetical protein